MPQEKVHKNSDSINTYICPGYCVNNWEGCEVGCFNLRYIYIYDSIIVLLCQVVNTPGVQDQTKNSFWDAPCTEFPCNQGET